jgi:hypothetical protein
MADAAEMGFESGDNVTAIIIVSRLCPHRYILYQGDATNGESHLPYAD